jgi:hypothetical protein
LCFPCIWGWQVHTINPDIGQDRVLQTFGSNWPQTAILPISASRVARITCFRHHVHFITFSDIKWFFYLHHFHNFLLFKMGIKTNSGNFIRGM